MAPPAKYKDLNLRPRTFVAWCSIQLNYGGNGDGSGTKYMGPRKVALQATALDHSAIPSLVWEAGFEPAIFLLPQ